MRLDDLPTSDRIEDRRGLPGGRAGLGVGTVVILGLLAWAFGIDPRVLIGGAETMSRNGQTQQQTDAGSTGAPSDDMGRFLSAILGSTNGQEPLRPRAGGGYRLVSVQPASNHPGPARPSDDDDAGPLCLLRHLGQHQTIALVRLSGRQDLEEMAVASGSSASAPLGSTE